MPLYIRLLHTALGVAIDAVFPSILLLVVVGVVTATIQSALQLEDTALSLLPKTAVMIIIAMLGGFGAFDLFRSLALAWISHATMLAHQPWS